MYWILVWQYFTGYLSASYAKQLLFFLLVLHWALNLLLCEEVLHVYNVRLCMKRCVCVSV